MRSCIAVFYIAVCGALAAAQPDADALYRDRETLASAQQAAALWAARLAGRANDFEAAWKLARVQYWLGTNGLPPDQRRTALDAGVAAGRRAAGIDPAAPHGHFWMAANMGALAESFGVRQGVRYRGAIRESLERVRAIDPAFLDGSADRALGRWYYRVPGLFGGSKRKSEEHLRHALAYNPDSVITRLFLADTLLALGRRDEARRELAAAVAAPVSEEWAPEDRRFRDQARARLAALAR